MGLLVECPECKKRNSVESKNCKCGFVLAKFSGRVWWIEYYDLDGRRRRQRIGNDKASAEQELRTVLKARRRGGISRKALMPKSVLKTWLCGIWTSRK